MTAILDPQTLPEPATIQSPAGPTRPADRSLIDVARILLLVMGAVAAVATLEVLVVAAAGVALVGPLVALNALWTVWLLVAARGVGRRSRRARRWALIAVFGALTWAALDTTLAIVLAQRSLELVPTLTRIVIPFAVWRILRRPWVRAEFGAKQSRRYRRKAARTS